jgi:hypothetical protein
VLIVVCLLPGRSAAAQEAGTPPPTGPDATEVRLVLEPGEGELDYLQTEIEPGDEAVLPFLIGSVGPEPLDVLVYPADVYSLVNGGFGIEEAGEPISAPTTWLDYEPEALLFAPGQVEERTVTVRVPLEAPPGQYVTGLVIQTAEPLAVGGQQAVTQTLRRAMAIEILVPGPVEPALTIGAATYASSPAASTIRVEIANPGNILLRPAGTFVLSQEGETVAETPVAMGSVYAGTTTALEIGLPVPLPDGEYAVALTLEDDETGAQAAVSDLPLVVSGGSSPVSPVTIASFEVREARDPATNALLYVEPVLAIENGGEALPTIRVTLNVRRDGQTVEAFPLVAGMPLPVGASTVQGRYVPPAGWQPGAYAFDVTVEAIDPTSGAATLLATAEAAAPVIVA